MHRRKFILLFLIIILVAGMICFGVARRPRTSVTLKDGSVVKVEKVTFGKRGPYTPPGGGWQSLKGKFIQLLPKKWAERFPKPPTGGGRTSWNYAAQGHTNLDALQIWFTRWDPAAQNYSGYQPLWAEVIDDDGCVLPMTTAGGEMDPAVRQTATAPSTAAGFGWQPPVTMNWMTFEAFPRHDAQFRLRLYDMSRNYVTELVVQNPAYTPRRGRGKPAPPLPVTAESGDVKFTLASLRYRTNQGPDNTSPRNGNPMAIVPVFEAVERGQPSKNWRAVDAELWDSAGNFASKMAANTLTPVFDSMYLCPNEDAWRLKVTFYGTEDSAVATNAVWKIPGVKIPAGGELQTFAENRELQGVSVWLMGIAGRGVVTYSNGMPVSAAIPGNPQYSDMTMTGAGRNMQSVVRTTTATLAVKVVGLGEKQRLSVRARDDQGRDVYAKEWNYGYKPDPKNRGEVHFVSWGERHNADCVILDLPEDSKTVDLTIGVHTGRAVEFKFKPPAKGGK